MRLLVVDDDPLIRRVLAAAFEEQDQIQLTVMDSARDALTHIGEDPPDVILIDQLMPGMDGLTFMAALRADPKLSDLPVIFCTGRTDPELLNALRKSGARGVISKPFDPFDLPDLIRQHLERGPVDG